jgi:hypothetical protein
MTTSTGRNAKLIAMLLGISFSWHGVAFAQNNPVTEAEIESALSDVALLDDTTLDAMTSPIALYPDTLLGQVLIAATYPMDVMKADRFLMANADLTDRERAAAVNDQDWPDAVKSLAAGFPELVSRMAEHIDWTETMGQALISQTDDVLASIQRLRAQAKVNGYLDNNPAMTVETDVQTQNITITSTNPNMVYVPEYTNVVYSQPAPPTSYYVYDTNNPNYYWGDALATGVVVWGTVAIIDNIFDDDWGNGWDNDYWHGNGHGGGNSIDWDGDINIDNGINIGNGNIGSGNRPSIDTGGMIIGGDKITGIDKSKLTNIDKSKVANMDRSKVTNMDRSKVTNFDRSNIGNGAQIGGVDQDRLDRARDTNFKPTSLDRDAARAKLASREASGRDLSTLPPAKGVKQGAKDYAPAAKTKLATRPAEKPTTKPIAKPAAVKPAAAKPANSVSANRPTPKVSKPNLPSKPPNRPKPAAKGAMLEQHGGSRAGAASARGNASRKGR